MNFNELRDRAYKCACDHGFHDKEYSDEHWMMLIITEISEAVNADRKGKYAEINVWDKWTDKFPIRSNEDYIDDFERYVKDSVEDELADVVIRLLDFAGAKGIDINLNNISLSDIFIQDTASFCENCYALCQKITDLYYCSIQCKFEYLLFDAFELAKLYSIDLFKFIDLKMRYNELRPYKNGKNY